MLYSVFMDNVQLSLSYTLGVVLGIIVFYLAFLFIGALLTMMAQKKTMEQQTEEFQKFLESYDEEDKK